MFTGLVEERGTLASAEKSGDRQTGLSLRLTVKAPLVAQDAQIGDSIAVNGCCLTVVKKSRQTLSFDAGSETLRR
ncbi:MAG TPA: riboflavin synthase, partial [Pirellulaceae bacterium]|nr:riboflavin synthase [Pirellulaceae bacterium]